ncbi:MAG: bifunctional serine/threonine-protein kinase/formylglycine-generating enzyme family protein [Rhabdochlamydiaceae bacterium]|jgi:formylglycine-generating enzyme required for sulfatase activity
MRQSQIADYLLIQELGRGSMGETFLAEHRFLKRLFILKVLPQELSSDAEFIKRFEKEILSLSKLEHPHIAKIHNASSSEGTYFLVSEPILDQANHSTNLAEYFVKKHYRLSEEEVFRIARQIASALDFAHEAVLGSESVSHGSIKLNNIVVKENKDGLQVHMTDFGLSRIIGPLAALSRTYYSVATSLAAGTGLAIHKAGQEKYSTGPWDPIQTSELHRSFCQSFLFLAPEQKMIGHPKSSPIKADIYAFGVLLYYLLTGEFPEGYFELPSKKVPELKWNWDLLICRALQTDPLKRPENLSIRIEELINSTSLTSPRIQLQKLKTIAEENVELASRLAPSSAGPHSANLSSLQVKPLLKPKEITRPSFEADPGAVFQTEMTVSPYKLQPQEEKEIEPLQTEMAIVPGGTYLRGSNHGGRDEMPRHAIHLPSFAIDTHPVTNEQFVLFLEAMGGEKDSNNSDIIRLRESRIKRVGGKLNIESGYVKHPVVGVSWYGAISYAKWVGKRLPSEAEWEVASYGGREDFIFPTGNQLERTEANFFSSDTTPVMSYPPNGFGLYDMAGNVYEWCQDWYDYHFYDLSVQEPNHPKGPLQGVYRILRGGCWKSSKEDLRCAHRHRNNPGIMNGTYGFRCVADVAEE